MGSKIVAIEYEYPEKKITNEDLKIEFPEYDFKQFESKVGIKSRYIVEKDETAFDLAVKACKKLLKKIDRNSVDYLLYCTQSPEYHLPSTACILQETLGLNKNVGALDFNLGCSGYTYGLSLAKALINSGQAKNILLVTAEAYSKYLHPKDRSNRAIFGDAASATLIAFSEKECVRDFVFGTDGSGYDKLIVKNGGSRTSFDASPAEYNYGTNNVYTNNHLYMDGPEVFNFTSTVIPDVAMEVLKKNGLIEEGVDQFILHQANAFMLNLIRRKLKVSKEKFFIDLEDGGNTVSSTIPIALKKYSQTVSDLHKEIVVVGFGVGLSWCGGVIIIDDKL